MNNERTIPRGAGKSFHAAYGSTTYELERAYEVARSCLADAIFVANEREYHGVVALVARAQDALEAIGKLAGIDRSALLDYPVIEDDEGEAPTPAQEADIERAFFNKGGEDDE